MTELHTSEGGLSRRKFLHRSGGGAVAMGLAASGFAAIALPAANAQEPQTAAANEAPGGKKLGWALVGIGRLSQNQLLPALKKSRIAKLAGLVSGDPNKANAIADQFGLDHKHVYHYDNYDQIANDDTIDVIYIVLPNGMHAEYTVRAAKAGKHVFSEKPMANTVAECQQMIDACKSAGKMLGVGYRLQYEPHHLKAIELVRTRAVGMPKLISSDNGFNIGPGQWRTDKKLAGGGAVMDVGIYSINACRYLTGEEPVEVTAQVQNEPDDPRFKTVEASMAYTMKFGSGVMASCTTTYTANSAGRYRVMGEKGQILMEPAFGYGGLQLSVIRGREPEQLDIPNIDQFANEMDEFSRCILENKPTRTPGEEGLKDLKVIEALYRASNEGKAAKV